LDDLSAHQAQKLGGATFGTNPEAIVRVGYDVCRLPPVLFGAAWRSSLNSIASQLQQSMKAVVPGIRNVAQRSPAFPVSMRQPESLGCAPSAGTSCASGPWSAIPAQFMPCGNHRDGAKAVAPNLRPAALPTSPSSWRPAWQP